MNKDRILLKLVLDKIGFANIEINNFSARKILQKKIYLFQLTGVDLGYRYNWYLRGPYCPALADNTFSLKEEIEYDNEYEKYELNSETIEKFDILENVEKLPINPQTVEHEWLELVASLHYLKHIAYWGRKDNPDFPEVFQKLVESKPHFEDKRHLAQVAWERLDEVGLVAQKVLT